MTEGATGIVKDEVPSSKFNLLYSQLRKKQVTLPRSKEYLETMDAQTESAENLGDVKTINTPTVGKYSTFYRAVATGRVSQVYLTTFSAVSY